MKEVRKFAREDTSMLLVGNKADLEHKRKVTKEQGQEIADIYHMKFMEVSAKTGMNVSGMFSAIVEEVEKMPMLMNEQGKDKTSVVKGKALMLSAANSRGQIKRSGCC
eukprot:TRINITY_DN4268_c0_g3_i10.p1 TRINITY_DN4268_c0_g3~~TRINITY_DN4268_c0_g3_i10.p1  ORF type:complete len:108 (+),score=28.12 TRINITY_DN4268_c0_g3_i10:449-772(+)